MNNNVLEQGVLFSPVTLEEQEFASQYIQVCRQYNIDLSKADDMERNFVLSRTNYLLSKKTAV